jgi:hypothetical protein
MPLQVQNRVLRSNEVQNVRAGKMVLFDAPKHIPITMWGYGRIDRSSPVEGLSTAGVASCTAVIFHCKDTGRSVLTHSPNFLQMNTFVPMIEWLAGGTGEGLETYAKREMWKMGFGAKPSAPCAIDVGVFRGFSYANNPGFGGHANWMKDFRNVFAEIEKNHPISFSILDEHILKYGSIYIDKSTGVVSIPTLSGAYSRHTVGGISNPTYDKGYGHLRGSRDSFVGNYVYSKQDVLDLHLQWDMQKYQLAIPVPADARLYIRNKLGDPRASADGKRNLDNLLKHLHEMGTPGRDENVQMDDTLRGCVQTCLDMGMPCETCHNLGDKRCSKCGGAWYCSREHQETDWKEHKGWCKKNRLQ